MDLTLFKNLIKDKSGLLFDNERSKTLRTSILGRMLIKGLESHFEYFNYLLHDQDEFHCLINLLTINQTHFYREPKHYQLFSEQLIPKLLKNKKKIRILSEG